MRYLILSDIHSNREAFFAVLAHVRRKRWDKAVFLGDLVGYGANPNQTVDMLRSLRPLLAIRGNHDKVCSGIEDGEMFNRVALQAALWTRSRLTRRNLTWLRALPEGPLVVDGAFAIAHGTPIDEDAYIFGEIEALNVFRQTAFPLCFFGHSHFPVIFGLSPDAIHTVLTGPPSFRFRLEPGMRYLVNPGSIGQPRDGNPTRRSPSTTPSGWWSRSTACPIASSGHRRRSSTPDFRVRSPIVSPSDAERAQGTFSAASRRRVRRVSGNPATSSLETPAR